MAGTKSRDAHTPQVPRADIDPTAAQDAGLVIPVIAEELHPDVAPVQTGGVRITKRVDGHEEVLEQELRKGRVEVKRVRTDRVVDGPQEPRRAGNTLIVPVVSEVLHVEKQWVVTEEIHVTQLEERETVQQKVHVNQEHARVERLDASGNAVSSIEPEPEHAAAGRHKPATVLKGEEPARRRDKKRILSSARSLLKNKDIEK